jgi:hypothetical protein
LWLVEGCWLLSFKADRKETRTTFNEPAAKLQKKREIIVSLATLQLTTDN